MKKQNVTRILLAFLVLCVMVLSSCNSISFPSGNEEVKTEQGNINNNAPDGEYNEGVVLVKYDGEIDDNILSQLDFKSAEPLYNGSDWYYVNLRDASKTEETVAYLRELGCFDEVDYDYVMGTTEEGEAKVTDNPNYSDQTNLGLHNIPNGWTQNDKHPGGSPDVVVAVIDTGVDYNHLDLRNNIWTNPAEIPDNNKDDDGNGYIDDVYGWDCVGDDNDPMDDNGHGTHVAGIIAAENNKLGGIGVAYGCKVMVLKAGNSSGYFNNSDIAEAIQYAYMNGASVINMSFGGSSISIAVKEALEDAYNSCVLVAAAGNAGLCNDPFCSLHTSCAFYPAALQSVIGVMSCNASGTAISKFSNYDHILFNSFEYEVYACGENLPSTWPNNKYATLSGTSMACPTVAGIAAVLRSTYSDREVYSNKYIQSQIVNTGNKSVMTHKVVDLYEAMTKVPKPSVHFYDYYVFDNVEYSNKNNGDGRIDAGETIRIGIELMNGGGVASNVTATIDTIRNGDENLVEPYFEIVKNQMILADIGTYSIRDSELIYTNGLVTSTKSYFEIIVSEDCPNDYRCVFNVNLSYTNGLDQGDTNIYTNDYNPDKFELTVTNGFVLPTSIQQDTVFPGNKRYILSSNVTIANGVTVTFEAGSIIQFYENSQGYYNTIYNSPTFINYGTLIFSGTEFDEIFIKPSELFFGFACVFENHGELVFTHTNVTNIDILQPYSPSIADYDSVEGHVSAYNSSFCVERPNENSLYLYKFFQGQTFESDTNITIHEMEGCEVNITKTFYKIFVYDAAKSIFTLGGVRNELITLGLFNNNIVLEEEIYWQTSKVHIGANANNNVFLQVNNSHYAKDYSQIILDENGRYLGNKFYGMYLTHPDTFIENLFDENGNCRLDVNDTTNQDLNNVYPFIANIHMEDKEGNIITRCGTEKVKFVIDFNREMDITKETKLFFGTKKPYADYEIEGEWVNEKQWVGYYTLKATIENGEQRFRLSNAWTNETEPLECLDNGRMYTFIIDTTAAMSMNLQASPQSNGIELKWFQDDYDTLLGYNIYRADSKDGNYVKLNRNILLPSDEMFIDEDAEPGKTYWYTYTVVLSDFSESNPAGKIMATAKDTIAPNIYHTPVNQGYTNNNLVISCTASDNVGIDNVILYYRTYGELEWESITMSKVNNKYNATIFGSELNLSGLEYYIVASDGRNNISKGSAEVPYFVLIKDSSLISRIGDVDGDGTITTKDALMIMQCINGDLILTDDEFKRADLNKDGLLSSVEALRILQYINGNVPTLDM